ncbi:hypothetical protein, partial [Caenimonas sedimenti]|uniref:hypothetical protein n=1 Tax=Caenimonas sedimenti TaxID=2596921 RepID=UPI001C960FDD
MRDLVKKSNKRGRIFSQPSAQSETKLLLYSASALRPLCLPLKQPQGRPQPSRSGHHLSRGHGQQFTWSLSVEQRGRFLEPPGQLEIIRVWKRPEDSGHLAKRPESRTKAIPWKVFN